MVPHHQPQNLPTNFPSIFILFCASKQWIITFNNRIIITCYLHVLAPPNDYNAFTFNERFSVRVKVTFQFDFGPSIERWLTANYPQSCYHMAAFKGHQARLYITNYQKPRHCFDCNTLWCSLFGACWLFSAPCYKVSYFVCLKRVCLRVILVCQCPFHY